MSKSLQVFVMLSPLLVSLVSIIMVFTMLKYLPPKLPLFYSLLWGESQLATHQQFLIIPAIISIITFLNLAVSWQLHPSQAFLKKALLGSAIAISLILITAFSKIILMFA